MKRFGQVVVRARVEADDAIFHRVRAVSIRTGTRRLWTAVATDLHAVLQRQQNVENHDVVNRCRRLLNR